MNENINQERLPPVKVPGSALAACLFLTLFGTVSGIVLSAMIGT